MQKKRIAYFLSHPIQYFSPLLKELAKKTDLMVYYFSDASIKGNIDKGFGKSVRWDIPLLDGYAFRFLKNFSKRASLNNHFFDVFNPSVIKILWKEKASIIIINDWKYSSTLLVIFFGRIFGKQVWLRAENPHNQELNKKRKTLLLKRIFLEHILFKIFISKCLYIGSESKLFFEFYGVPLSKMIYTPYAVDNVFFSTQYCQLKNKLQTVRQQLSLPDKKIILFCGKYIAKKRPLDLLRAFHLCDDNNYALVMVGEGILRKEMEDYINENDLQEIYLTGFVNQTLIPKYYAIADVFVMCSGIGETWGLSVNEAMNFEKSVIVSKTCGCCRDLVKHGENGFAFDEGNITELAGYLKKVLDDDDFRLSAGKKSAEIISRFSVSDIVSNITDVFNDN
jgi:glycosyltransferase involved in cell wall biosynthesis